MDNLILVDEQGNPIGVMEKLEAHRLGKLHRCFSILVFNSKGELMLQKRASEKYHSANLWTNTTGGHPKPEETDQTIESAKRRLKLEMGFTTELIEVDAFIYKAALDKGLTENEFDHVSIGQHDKEPILNPDEAGDWRWMSIPDIKKDVAENPDKYTYWFKLISPN